MDHPPRDLTGSPLLEHLEITTLPMVPDLVERRCDDLITNDTDRMPGKVDIEYQLPAGRFVALDHRLAESILGQVNCQSSLPGR